MPSEDQESKKLFLLVYIQLQNFWAKKLELHHVV